MRRQFPFNELRNRARLRGESSVWEEHDVPGSLRGVRIRSVCLRSLGCWTASCPAHTRVNICCAVVPVGTPTYACRLDLKQRPCFTSTCGSGRVLLLPPVCLGRGRRRSARGFVGIIKIVFQVAVFVVVVVLVVRIAVTGESTC